MARNKKKAGGKGGQKTPKPYSALQHHKQTGKVLTPPLLNLPAPTGLRSWTNDHLADVLWMALLVKHLPRAAALTIFRHVAKALEDTYVPGESAPMMDVGHSGLATLPGDLGPRAIRAACATAEARAVLRPLLLLEALPLAAEWRQAIGAEPVPEEDWDALRVAVAHVFNHQSQEATDCRWLRVLVMLVSGQLKVPTEEMAREIAFDPDEGDQRKVRPTIRAIEMSFAGEMAGPRGPWPAAFWAQCMRDTVCIPHELALPDTPPPATTTVRQIDAVARALAAHARATSTTTAVDAKHEAVFGMALYALATLRELLRLGASTGIMARLGLRALLEVHVSLRYLAGRNKPGVWETYRQYGSGQAKLAFLKLDDDDAQGVGFVDAEALNAIANEDRSTDFVPINLGHWENSNLRLMSDEAGVKGDYDRFYPWTSAYMHANWGAVRSVSYDLCVNALHRAHRVLRTSAASLNDVVPDACELVDRVLEMVDGIYPTFSGRVTISTSAGGQ